VHLLSKSNCELLTPSAFSKSDSAIFLILARTETKYKGSAMIHATRWIINASYYQHQRFFHLSPEPLML
jgi:hypothetical protein